MWKAWFAGMVPAVVFAMTAVISVPNPANALDCTVVETTGDSMGRAIASDLSRKVAGQKNEITGQKTLILNNVVNVWFTGCEIEAMSQVTVKREFKSTLHGLVSMKGQVTKFDDTEICVANIGFVNGTLPKDASISRAVYNWVVGQSLPNGTCFAR